MPGRRPHRDAFTLVEMLAVVVLLGLAASLGAVGLASADSHARFERAVAIALDADAQARLLARGGAPVRMVLEPDERGSDILIVKSDSRVRELSLPHGVHVAWIDPESGALLSEIRYDTLGQSPEYLLRASDGDRTQVWRITGLTGWAEELGPEVAR